jgi:hypothetical protein
MNKAGAQVEADTGLVEISGGNTVTFNRDGDGAQISGGANKPSFKVVNQWKNPSRIVVSSKDLGTGKYSPIFVSPAVVMGSTNVFTPVNKVGIWIDLSLSTKTMFMTSATNPFIVDLSNTNTATIRYEDGAWSQIA